MCGIIGGIAQRDLAPVLIEGLKRLEYRGYDSAGLAVIGPDGRIRRERTEGKVRDLEAHLMVDMPAGSLGIAHTRWATHGVPAARNAHPHVCRDQIAVVHNGIVENHEELREAQRRQGHRFTSDTDTEVIVHAVYDQVATGAPLLEAVQRTCASLKGAFALGVVSLADPGCLVAARQGSPLVIGLGIGENFIASDVAALLPVTRRFVFLDEGDTPAFPGVYHTAANVVGATLQAGELLATGEAKRVFVPIAGLHHAARDKTSGFCVFNDIGVLIEYLRKQHGIRRIAYVDIDAHHGDGVFYGFASDPDVIFTDMHEDGRFLFPGTGARNETGIGAGEGTKLNIPLHPGADDEEFVEAWSEMEAFLDDARPEFFILVAGADSIAGDPLTHLQFTEDAHGAAARAVCRLADRYAEGRVLGLGGGGYNRRNVASAWSRVVKEFADSV